MNIQNKCHFLKLNLFALSTRSLSSSHRVLDVPFFTTLWESTIYEFQLCTANEWDVCRKREKKKVELRAFLWLLFSSHCRHTLTLFNRKDACCWPEITRLKLSHSTFCVNVRAVALVFDHRLQLWFSFSRPKLIQKFATFGRSRELFIALAYSIDVAIQNDKRRAAREHETIPLMACKWSQKLSTREIPSLSLSFSKLPLILIIE